MASEANSSFISRSFIIFLAICSLLSIDGAGFWDCLSPKWCSARPLAAKLPCRRFAPGWKTFTTSTEASKPDFDPLKPSQDRDGPPCQVWGQWDQRCGRPLITHIHTHIWQIYIRLMWDDPNTVCTEVGKQLGHHRNVIFILNVRFVNVRFYCIHLAFVDIWRVLVNWVSPFYP